MKTCAEQVLEFHQKFQCAIGLKPTLADYNTARLRTNLIAEEFVELMKGMGFACTVVLYEDNEGNDPRYFNSTAETNLVEVADGIADLHYVLSGTSIAYGIPEDKVIEEVHRSNMSKVWNDGTVHYREDGKVIKPDTYSPADIESILENA